MSIYHDIWFGYVNIFGFACIEIRLNQMAAAAFRFLMMAVHAILFIDNKLAMLSLI